MFWDKDPGETTAANFAVLILLYGTPRRFDRIGLVSQISVLLFKPESDDQHGLGPHIAVGTGDLLGTHGMPS